MKKTPFYLQFPLNMRFENYLPATCYRHFSICGKPILELKTCKEWHNLVNRSCSVIVHKANKLWTYKKWKLLFVLKIWSFPFNNYTYSASFFLPEIVQVLYLFFFFLIKPITKLKCECSNFICRYLLLCTFEQLDFFGSFSSPPKRNLTLKLTYIW